MELHLHSPLRLHGVILEHRDNFIFICSGVVQGSLRLLCSRGLIQKLHEAHAAMLGA